MGRCFRYVLSPLRESCKYMYALKEGIFHRTRRKGETQARIPALQNLLGLTAANYLVPKVLFGPLGRGEDLHDRPS